MWVIVLSLLMLALGLGNLARAALACRYAALLPELPMTVSWAYLAATSALWGVALVACAVGLLRLRAWGRWLTLAVVTGYELHVWINHLVFDASDYARQTWPRDLLLTLLLLALVWGSLSLPGVRRVLRSRRSHTAREEADEKIENRGKNKDKKE